MGGMVEAGGVAQELGTGMGAGGWLVEWQSTH